MKLHTLNALCSTLLIAGLARGKWIHTKNLLQSYTRNHVGSFLGAGPKDVETTYIGAVLEYEPYNEWKDQEKGFGVLRKNAEIIVDFVIEAKVKVRTMCFCV